jgi:hypothetical protein
MAIKLKIVLDGIIEARSEPVSVSRRGVYNDNQKPTRRILAASFQYTNNSMKKMLGAIGLVMVLVMLTDCGWMSNRNNQHRKVERIFSGKNPENDALNAFRAGDYRVLLAMSYCHYFPGIDREIGDRWSRIYSSRTLPTTDAIESRAHRAAITAVVQYAAAYNKKLYMLLHSASKL